MLAIVYPTQPAAQAALDAINRSLGYPRTYSQADVDAGTVRLARGVRIADVTTKSYAEITVLGDGTCALRAFAEMDDAKARATPPDAALIPQTRDAVVVSPSAAVGVVAQAIADAPVDVVVKP